MLATLAVAITSSLCPNLAGDYNCVTSFSTKSEPWSLTQSFDATGFDVYAFDGKEYVADAADHLDPNVSYKLTYNARCLAGLPGVGSQLVINELGDVIDRGKHYQFTNQNVLDLNAEKQLVSRFSHDGKLIDTMVCTRR